MALADNIRGNRFALRPHGVRWALAAVLLAGACDFSLLESPAIPKWDIALTMPLINQSYSMAGVVDSSTIFADSASQELQVQFGGELDTTTIDSDFRG